MTITAEYGTPACTLTWEHTGDGYIEVWTTDTYETDGADWAEPAGDQYSMFDEAPFDSNIAIFVFPGGEPLSSENSHKLLVELWNATSLFESNPKMSSKNKHRASLWSNNLIFRNPS